jgi:hypothetical protein
MHERFQAKMNEKPSISKKRSKESGAISQDEDMPTRLKKPTPLLSNIG